MKIVRLLALLGIGALALSLGVASFVPEVPGGGPGREMAKKAFLEGNYRDAYEGFKALTLEPQPDDELIGKDLEQAIECLRRLGRSDEVDALRNEAISLHPERWRLLTSAAWTIFRGEHHGQLIAGKLFRGHADRQGRYVNTWERDRVESIRLMLDGLRRARSDSPAEIARGYLNLAQLLLNDNDGPGAWRLPRLTDLEQVPDFDNGWARPISLAGAPVEADGSPVFYRLPARWEDARNDGERWRWVLARASETDPNLRDEIRWQLAQFFRSQYGVETFLQSLPLPRMDVPAPDPGFDPHGLASLPDGETIAKLASGVRRFPLPDEFNPIRLLRSLADDSKGKHGELALQGLADIFETRNQYDRAAKVLEEVLARYGPSEAREMRLSQIVKPWGRVEPGETQPAGQPGTITLRHRNAKRARFEARPILIDAVLDDVRSYVRSTPEQLDWRRLNLAEIGRMAMARPDAHLGPVQARWSSELSDGRGHADARTVVSTPLTGPGAYLVKVEVDGGNTVHGVVWLVDTVIFKKTIAGQTYFQVVDALSGHPIPNARIELFGYRQRMQSTRVTSVIDTLEDQVECDADGRGFFSSERPGRPASYTWLVVARGDRGRMAFLGFLNVNNGVYQDYRNDQLKLFLVTDRPSYRPGQVVRFKGWHARVNPYGAEDRAVAANQPVTIEAINSRGERISGHDYVADRFGGIHGEIALPSDAAAGLYSLRGLLANGSINFRVEVDAEAEHTTEIEVDSTRVLLGSPVNATIRARTAQGQPLTGALVRYKVVRVPAMSRLFPEAPWDWLYGQGYWWSQADAAWAPGWADWGCPAPVPGWQSAISQPAEVVAEAETPIGADGTVRVGFDTRLARTIHGAIDQDYRITAEVIDEQRRSDQAGVVVTAAGRAAVVQVWTEPGFATEGTPLRAFVAARDLLGQSIQADGHVELRRYVHESGQTQEVPVPGSRRPFRGKGDRPIPVDLPGLPEGQYRVACVVDAPGVGTIEGGCVLNVLGSTWETSKSQRFKDLELILDRPEYRPGDTARLLINADRPDSTVFLFIRPAYGVATIPKVLRLQGKSTTVEIPIQPRDQPNIFVEATLVSRAKIVDVIREVPIPPRQHITRLEVEPGSRSLRPGQSAKFKVRLEDQDGAPVSGPVALTLYDSTLDSQGDGPNVLDMNAFFWGWRRLHSNVDESSLVRNITEILRGRESGMLDLGYVPLNPNSGRGMGRGGLGRGEGMPSGPGAPNPPGMMPRADAMMPLIGMANIGSLMTRPPSPRERGQAISSRRGVAQSSVWAGSILVGADGQAEIEMPMPSQLGAWTIRAWSLGQGARVGQAVTQVVTAKDILVRFDAPAFLVEGDEVVLEAVVSNRSGRGQTVRVRWDQEGNGLESSDPVESTVEVAGGSVSRVTRRVKATLDGPLSIVVRAEAETDSDQARWNLPVRSRGLARQTALPVILPADATLASLGFDVPGGLRGERTRLDVQVQSSLSSVMVDALPGLVALTPRSTEETLQRFLPLILAQRTLLRLGVNLNAEASAAVPAPVDSALAGQASPSGPAFSDLHPALDRDTAEVLVRTGLNRLAEVQLADGGWGWFHGFGEQSHPHATALVVLGLLDARACDLALEPGVLERGVAWLHRYQDHQLRLFRNRAGKTPPYRDQPEALDVLVYRVLVEAGIHDEAMASILDAGRKELGLLGEVHLALALERRGESTLRSRVERELGAFLERDRARGVAQLRLPVGVPWWNWKGSEIELNAAYLDYLTRTAAQSELTAEVARGLVRARQGGAGWISPRATGQCVAALARYLHAAGERVENLAVGLSLDRQPEAMLSLPARVGNPSGPPMVYGQDRPLQEGGHTLSIRKEGGSPLYLLGILTTSREIGDPSTHNAQGDIRIRRDYARLEPPKIASGATTPLVGRSPLLGATRHPLTGDESLDLGDIVEVEIQVESKSDLESIEILDPIAAGLDVLDLSSGYGETIPNAFVERREDSVRLHIAAFPKGRTSLTYRLRVARTGQFTAPPVQVRSPYVPEPLARSSEGRFLVRASNPGTR